jgi:hypothetical protein
MHGGGAARQCAAIMQYRLAITGAGPLQGFPLLENTGCVSSRSNSSTTRVQLRTSVGAEAGTIPDPLIGQHLS